MHVSLNDAEAQLEDLVRLAEQGEYVVLTRDGRPAVRLEPIPRVELEHRRRVLDEVREASARDATPGPCAARSQDFLYDEDGLPA